MTAIVHVKVTAEAIAAAGDDRMAWAAPVEVALSGAFGGEAVSIDSGGPEFPAVATIGQDEWTLVLDLPAAANEWLDRRWDGDPDDRLLGSEPFDFDIEIPRWVCALIPSTDLVTLAEASRALKTISANSLRTAARNRRDGLASETALAGRLGMVRIGRDWFIPRQRLLTEVARRTTNA